MEKVSQICLPAFLAPSFAWFKQIGDAGSIGLSAAQRFDEDPRYNRLQFAGPHGLQQFSIPLVGDSKKGTVADLRISYAEKWQNHLVNALRTAYGKSPFYEYYDYKLEPILKTPYDHLMELNTALIRMMAEAFKLNLDIHLTDGEPEAIPINNEHGIYYQVFADRNGFIPDLSLLDYLFNEGWDLDWKKG